MPESPGPARKPRTSQTTCTREKNQTTCTRAQKQTACTRAQLAGAAELRFAEEPLRGRAGCLGQAATVRWRAPGRMPALPVSGPGVTGWIQRSSRRQPAQTAILNQNVVILGPFFGIIFWSILGSFFGPLFGHFLDHFWLPFWG